jgi:hypothetical protein
MSHSTSRWQIIQALLAIVGAGLAFAFLQAGAFRDVGIDTLRRMVTPDGLRAALLGATVTAMLLAPVLLWQRHRNRRRAV